MTHPDPFAPPPIDPTSKSFGALPWGDFSLESRPDVLGSGADPFVYAFRDIGFIFHSSDTTGRQVLFGLPPGRKDEIDRMIAARRTVEGN